MEVGDVVQIWDESTHSCLGFGKIIAFGVGEKEGAPLISLERCGRQIWGDEYVLIPKAKALEATERLFKDLMRLKDNGISS